MANLLMHCLNGPAKLFFFCNVRPGLTYEHIREIMLAENNSDARQLQVQGHLRKLASRNIMNEEVIFNVGKCVSTFVAKLEELVSECHPESQTNRHKILFLSNANSNFSEWSLGPMENINAHRYTFSRFVTALYEFIQAKQK